MKSKLAGQSERALLAAMQRLTPEERLIAFLEHSRLVMSLYLAGEQQRSGNGRGVDENTRAR